MNVLNKKYKREEILATPRIKKLDKVKSDLYVLDPFFNDIITKFRYNGIINVLKLHENCDDNDLIHMDRNLLEGNEYYQQIVVGLIIRCKDEILLLKCINGDMSGNYTLIQGHVKYMPFDHSKSLYDILLQNINIEFSEEINLKYSELEIFNKEQLKRVFDPKLKFITFNSYDNKKISYYHIGYIFEIDLSNYPKMFSGKYFKSGEPDKNKVEFVSVFDFTDYTFDNWVSEIADYYRRILSR